MNDLDDFFKSLSEFPSYDIELGVFDSSGEHESKNGKGLKNSELMFIMERGSPIKHIPPRPVLQMTVDDSDELVNKTIDKILDDIISGKGEDAPDRRIGILCERLKNYAQDIIYSNDGRLKDNAKSTIRQKGFNHPLFGKSSDTAHLARQIQCIYKKEVVKNG